MNLVGKLKDEVEQAKTPEELKQAFLNAGIELSEEELDAIAGGIDYPEKKLSALPSNTIMQAACLLWVQASSKKAR